MVSLEILEPTWQPQQNEQNRWCTHKRMVLDKVYTVWLLDMSSESSDHCIAVSR